MNWYKKYLKSLSDPTPGEASEDSAIFTPRAQQALALGRKESDRLHHHFMGTEHVLLGIMKLGQGTAVNVLTKKGINLENLRIEIEKQVGTGPDQVMVGNIPYTPRVRRVIALAQKETKQLGHTYVGTEHLLLGLLREGDGVAARVLLSLNFEIEQLRQDILHEVGENTASQQNPFDGEIHHNFTPRVQQALKLARDEAERLNHSFVGTEHILLGLIKLGQGVTVNVLAKAGMDLESVRASVERHLPKQPEPKPNASFPYTAQAKEMLSLAKSEGNRLGHAYLGTEHLLLGILATTKDAMADVWADFEIDSEKMRLEILRELDPNLSQGGATQQEKAKNDETADLDTEGEQRQDPRIRWPQPEPVDVSKRYDVYCIEHGQSVVYRNVLFKRKQGLFPGKESYPSIMNIYVGLELVDGKMIFLPMHSVYKFCDPGASADGEKVPPLNP